MDAAESPRPAAPGSTPRGGVSPRGAAAPPPAGGTAPPEGAAPPGAKGTAPPEGVGPPRAGGTAPREEAAPPRSGAASASTVSAPGPAEAVVGADGRPRCPWGARPAAYVAYHDEEWGRPLRGDDALFERLALEAFQAGLSWLTILLRRPAFRSAFAGFDLAAVARFGDADVARLLADPRIIRNRAKIEATIANARLALAQPEGLSALLWSFAPPPRPRPTALADVPAITRESAALAKELKRRGFRFVGPTTAYALMQATGMVDDHLAACHVPPGAVV